jgi:hypothetical protein
MKEMMHRQYKTPLNKYAIACILTEAFSPWKNRVKGGIGGMKSKYMAKLKPKFTSETWAICSKWPCDVHSKILSYKFMLKGCTPYEAIMVNYPKYFFPS